MGCPSEDRRDRASSTSVKSLLTEITVFACGTMWRIFSKFAGQGHFVGVTLFGSAVYLVHAHLWTRRGQVDKKTLVQRDTNQDVISLPS